MSVTLNDVMNLRQAMSARALLFATLLLVTPGVVTAQKAPFGDAQVKKIQRQGVPALLSELDGFYTNAPAAENAADYYLRALANLPEKDCLLFSGSNKFDLFRNIGSEDQRQTVRQLLDDNRVAIDALVAAPKFSKARYPVDLRSQTNSALAHLSLIRFGGALVAANALQKLQTNDCPGAVASILAILALAESLQFEPTIRSQEARFSCLDDAFFAINRLMNSCRLAESDLARLEERLSQATLPSAIERAMIGERCLGIDFFQKTPEAQLKVMRSSTSENSQAFQSIFHRDRASASYQADFEIFLGMVEVYLGLVKEGGPDMSTKRLDRLIRKHENMATPISDMLAGAYRKVFEKYQQVLARWRTIETAVAIERYSLRNGGRLPRFAGELVHSGNLRNYVFDPFDGKPMRFKILSEKGAYVVYSVGPDQVDDEGLSDGSHGKRTRDYPFLVIRGSASETAPPK